MHAFQLNIHCIGLAVFFCGAPFTLDTPPSPSSANPCVGVHTAQIAVSKDAGAKA